MATRTPTTAAARATATAASSGPLTGDDARRLALALPEATEQDHHGRPSFRVRGRIFATLWDEHHLNVMVDEAGIMTAAQSRPDVCSEVFWGKRLAAVRVDLRRADAGLVRELLTDAWERKAPAAVRASAEPRRG